MELGSSSSERRRGVSGVWALARRQHGVVSRAQLLQLGLSPDAIDHRLARGRLHPLWRGVYAVGRPDVGRRGRWMAAVLACGPEARLSHRSAAELWRMVPARPPGLIEVTVPEGVRRAREGIRVHRRRRLGPPSPSPAGIPVTDPITTVVDLSEQAPAGEVDAAINEADYLGLFDPPALRAALERMPPSRRVARLRDRLDRQELALPATVLERLFLRIVRRAKLPPPETQRRQTGHRVDFLWRDPGLVVEADSFRYHRSTAKQSADARRDNAHTTAGLATLRFTHAQVKHEPDYVAKLLARNLARLAK